MPLYLSLFFLCNTKITTSTVCPEKTHIVKLRLADFEVYSEWLCYSCAHFTGRETGTDHKDWRKCKTKTKLRKLLSPSVFFEYFLSIFIHVLNQAHSRPTVLIYRPPEIQMPALCIQTIPALARSPSAGIQFLLHQESRLPSSKKPAPQWSSSAVRIASQNLGTHANLEDFSSQLFYRKSSPREARVTQRAGGRTRNVGSFTCHLPVLSFFVKPQHICQWRNLTSKLKSQGSTLNSIKKHEDTLETTYEPGQRHFRLDLSNHNTWNIQLAKFHSLTAKFWTGHSTIYLDLFICVP